MRIALVSPTARRMRGYHSCGSDMPQLGLQVLAKLTPAEHSVEIIDEIFGHDQTEELLRRDRYDLVGITAYTSGARRAYELADLCKKRNLPCLMGGPHVWAMPDEALTHFDSIAVGECDAIWPTILADAAAGKLQRIYQGGHAELRNGLGTAAQSLRPINGRYDISCIQTSRGCPVGCEYCSVTQYNGAKIRRRDIDEVIEEWNQTDKKFVFVVDDNFFGVGPKDAEWAKQLLEAIIRRGKKRLWFSQTTINMGDDAEGLRLAYRAGCRGMLVGFESFNAENLKYCRKGINTHYLSRYGEMVRGFHRGGIAVFGAFIVGAEHDTEDTVADTVLQAVRLGVDIIQVTNLTPLPGTKLYQRFMEEGRIFATNFPADWERFTFVETVYHPSRMTAHRLDETLFELRQMASDVNWTLKRTLKSLWRTRSLSTAIFVHSVNSKFVKLAKALSPLDASRFGYIPGVNPRTEKIRLAMSLRCGAVQPDAVR
jgi:radical SAM superfamily enzyme YgiQ (UPF0313 family)